MPKGKLAIRSTKMITNVSAPDNLEKRLYHLQYFFCKDQRKKDGRDFEPDSNVEFSKDSSVTVASEYLLALSFDQVNFFNMTHLHFDFLMFYCFRDLTNFHLLNDTFK